jgi:uncharacterized membrane protein
MLTQMTAKGGDLLAVASASATESRSSAWLRKNRAAESEFLPSAPTPMAGARYILARERVHPVDIPFAAALKVFTRWCAGAGELVQAMQITRQSSISAPHV